MTTASPALAQGACSAVTSFPWEQAYERAAAEMRIADGYSPSAQAAMKEMFRRGSICGAEQIAEGRPSKPFTHNTNGQTNYNFRHLNRRGVTSSAMFG